MPVTTVPPESCTETRIVPVAPASFFAANAIVYGRSGTIAPRLPLGLASCCRILKVTPVAAALSEPPPR